MCDKNGVGKTKELSEHNTDGCCVREIGLLSLVYYHMVLFNERLTHVRKNEINAKYMNSE